MCWQEHRRTLVLLFLAGHRDATDGLTSFDISTLSNPLLHALRPVSARPSQNDLGLLSPFFTFIRIFIFQISPILWLFLPHYHA